MLCSQYGRTVNGRGPQAGRLRSLSFPIERRIPDYRLPTGCYVHIRCVYTAVLDGATPRTDTVGVLPACGAGRVPTSSSTRRLHTLYNVTRYRV